MRVRCPVCQNSVETAGEAELTDVVCSSCGSPFSLVAETINYMPQGAGGDAAAPRSLGHFLLLEQLGSGGFGTVWKARDTELDRLVAVKIPRRDQVDPADGEMFLREARAAAQLQHPGIVHVHEVGRQGDTLYIVSDLIQGTTLAERLADSPFSVRESVEIGLQVAAALHHAHEAGVIHRDLKPQNIMLNAQGQPHLMDFGLAKREAGEITVTMAGKVLGTPAYMSPEQARGEANAVDRRTDVYSLGVVLFELLTGERPFRGNVRMLLHQVIHDEPPSPRTLNGRVPRDLETIALKCLEKDPRRRYATAAEVAAELQRWQTGRPILARPINAAERTWRWAARNPAIATLASGIVMLLVTISLVASTAYFRAAADAEAKTKLASEKSNLATEKTALATKNAKLAQDEKAARENVEQQLRVATSDRLADQSRELLTEKPLTALLLAVEAADHVKPVRLKAENALRSVLSTVGGRIVASHDKPINDVTISPGGQWLITRTEDQTARVWDLFAADPLTSPRVLPAGRLSPNGRWLAARDGNTVRVWNLDAALVTEEPRLLRGPEGLIELETFSGDSRWLFTSSDDKTVRAWDLDAVDPTARVRFFPDHENQVTAVGSSVDGRWLVTSAREHVNSKEFTIRLWDFQATEPSAKPRQFVGGGRSPFQILISNNGQKLITHGLSDETHVWDLSSVCPEISLEREFAGILEEMLREDRTLSGVRALNLWNTNNFNYKSSRSVWMRQHYSQQRRFDSTPIGELALNLECRDEMIPVLAGLKYIYTCGELRREVVQLIAADINEESRRDVGRPGLDDWQIVVLAAVRLGCNFDYDKLQDQAENHRALRTLLDLGEWGGDEPSFSARRIRDTLCQLQPATLAALSHAVVSHGQALHGSAAASVRADSFVVETNIHYPTESSLIGDGMRKIIPLCGQLAQLIGAAGWRQSEHLYRRIKECVRTIAKISASQSPRVKERLPGAYEQLLDRVEAILERAQTLQTQAQSRGSAAAALAFNEDLQHWLTLTKQVCNTAYRRVILQEEVPNSDKLFSLFEPHTQLYRRGKAGEPNQFGRLLLVFEDGAGFISHYHLLSREQNDADVTVEQTREAQKKHRGQIKSASFDRGFHSTENERELAKIVDEPCLPPRPPQQYKERMETATVTFRNLRQHHPGVESAIGALQAGNGLQRCRDHEELGFERYLGLAILGRNIHVLGKLLIARQDPQSAAAYSKRQVA